MSQKPNRDQDGDHYNSTDEKPIKSLFKKLKSKKLERKRREIEEIKLDIEKKRLQKKLNDIDKE